MENPEDLKHYLVTGGTGGIGAAVCRALAAQGLAPIVGYREANEEQANLLAQECGGRVLKLDLNRSDSIDLAIAQISSLEAPFPGLVHCASPPPRPCPFGRITEGDMELFWRVNVLGPQRLLSGLVKQRLRKARQGVVVAVTSAAMRNETGKAMAGMGAYTISKFGLCGVLALLEAEYPWLRVFRISPGFTRTRMLEAFDERFIENVSAQNPLTEPEAVAREIVHCLGGD
jgi:3-oxoacyl-[acyl-carrier protein] reductase